MLSVLQNLRVKTRARPSASPFSVDPPCTGFTAVIRLNSNKCAKKKRNVLRQYNRTTTCWSQVRLSEHYATESYRSSVGKVREGFYGSTMPPIRPGVNSRNQKFMGPSVKRVSTSTDMSTLITSVVACFCSWMQHGWIQQNTKLPCKNLTKAIDKLQNWHDLIHL